MSQHSEPGRPSRGASRGGSRLDEALRRHAGRRRERLQAEIRRNRAGGHTVPTWVLALILVLLVGGWLYFVFTA